LKGRTQADEAVARAKMRKPPWAARRWPSDFRTGASGVVLWLR